MNIHFLEPFQWYFAALFIAVVVFRVLAWWKMRAARAQFVPIEHSMLDRPVRTRIFILHTGGVMLLAALLVIGLLHPVRTITVMEPEYESTATILALDISKSQRTESGYYGSSEGRLGAVKQTLLELLSAQKDVESAWFQFFMSPSQEPILKNQRVGVVVFAGQAHALTTPTDRHETIRSILTKHVSVSDSFQQGTNFAAAIEECLAGFSEDDTVRTIILVTDGEEDGDIAAPLEKAIADAREMRVRIFTVVVGHERAPVPGLENEWSEPSMTIPRHIAQATNGMSFAYDERGKLYPALEKIFSNVEETSKRPVVYEQDLRLWLAFAFLLILVGLVFFQYARR